MRDKYPERYQQLGVHHDVRLRKRMPVPVFVPPWVLEKIHKAKEQGRCVVLRPM